MDLGLQIYFVFGSECGDTDALMELAKILAEEPETFSGRPSPESEKRNDFSQRPEAWLSLQLFPESENTSNCSLPPIIFWELNTVKLF